MEIQLTSPTFPGDIRQDIQTIETILLRYGADKVILYGSLARGDYRPNSDIDICVQGLPAKNYFRALSECMLQTRRPMSVLDFASTRGYFRERILVEGMIIAMSGNELRKEIEFGLENLEKIQANILKFSQQNMAEEMVIAALTYECFGYYNALEHLMVRFLKYLKAEMPAGPFSHREIWRVFKDTAQQQNFTIDPTTAAIIENLMAFRHVATKIYSFLIDGDKLEAIIDDIRTTHFKIKQLFLTLLDKVTPIAS